MAVKSRSTVQRRRALSTAFLPALGGSVAAQYTATDRIASVGGPLPKLASTLAGTAAAPSAGISFIPTIPTQSFVRGVAGQSVDFDTLLATGAPAAGWAYEGTLPAGMSFDASTGILSGTPTVAGASALRVAASNVSREEAEWALRSTASGVLWATRFDNEEDVWGPDRYTGSAANFWQAYTRGPDGGGFTPLPGVNPYISRGVGLGIAGRNCLRLTFPANHNGGNPGSWNRMFVDGQKAWPVGQPLYLQYIVKRTDNPLAGLWPETKTSIVAGWGRTGWGKTNQDNELSTYVHGGSGTIMNVCSGSIGVYDTDFPSGGNFRYQNLIDRGPSITDITRRYCLYGSYIDVLAGGACRKYRQDVWLAHYFRFVLNANFTVSFRHEIQYEGETARTPLYDYPAWSTWVQQGTGVEENWFNTLTLLLQTTTRGGTDTVDREMRVGEVIVSTSPIAPRTIWTP